MSDPTTLSEFVDQDETEEQEMTANFSVTFASGPGRCEQCGEECRRRWSDQGDLVCPECKTW